jgi:hypothetical protein
MARGLRAQKWNRGAIAGSIINMVRGFFKALQREGN